MLQHFLEGKDDDVAEDDAKETVRRWRFGGSEDREPGLLGEEGAEEETCGVGHDAHGLLEGVVGGGHAGVKGEEEEGEEEKEEETGRGEEGLGRGRTTTRTKGGGKEKQGGGEDVGEGLGVRYF